MARQPAASAPGRGSRCCSPGGWRRPSPDWCRRAFCRPRPTSSRASLAHRRAVQRATLSGHARCRWSAGARRLGRHPLGLPVGIALAWLPPLRAVVTPAFELLRYIPPFAWVPIAVLWFGASTTTQAAIVFIAAFPACIINTQLAVSQVDPILAAPRGPWAQARRRRLAGGPAGGGADHLHRPAHRVQQRLDGAGRRRARRRQAGLGFLISQGQINDSAATILVGMTTIGVLGTLIDTGLQRAQRLALPWKSADIRPRE